MASAFRYSSVLGRLLLLAMAIARSGYAHPLQVICVHVREIKARAIRLVVVLDNKWRGSDKDVITINSYSAVFHSLWG